LTLAYTVNSADKQAFLKRNKSIQHAFLLELEAFMAVNKPTGDKARKGAVKKRTQLKNPLTKTSTKRNKKGGQFMAVKKSAKKFKGVRREK
jgi:putative protein kinase ArgK-like GTPase of G3E family